MFYYNEEGDLDTTGDEAFARRNHVRTLLGARNYPLEPEMAGMMHRALGPAPRGITRERALTQIHRALANLGYEDLHVEDVLEALDDSWKIALEVSAST